MTTTTTGAATSVSNSATPSNIMTTAQYKQNQQQAALSGDNGAMGQSAFLTLFTTQLKSQDPLNPMDNTAFVAQLAQFSQLEATTKMSTSMDGLVKSLSSSQISGAANMIGNKIGITDGKAIFDGTNPVTGTVSLPSDVDSVTLKVYSSTGTLVRTGQIGAQKQGDFPFTWDGLDDAGNTTASGTYRIEATTNKFGTTATAPVSTLATVRSVTTDATTGDMKLELNDGSNVSMSTVTRIGS